VGGTEQNHGQQRNQKVVIGFHESYLKYGRNSKKSFLSNVSCPVRSHQMPGLEPRDHVIHEYTKTVCPECFAEKSRRSDDPGIFLDGMIIERNGQILMRRHCPTHAIVDSLYEEDAEIWKSRFGWSTPTLAITPDRSDNFGSFPEGYREGLPASHGQHTCILLLNVTEHCNYSCPTCYAAAKGPGEQMQQPLKPSLEELLSTVDTMIEREGGSLGVLMLSGGEPTLRPDLHELLAAVMARPVTRVLLNTNGRRLHRDPKLVEMLASHPGRFEIYLQFDAVRPGPSQILRGEEVLEEKLAVLQTISKAGIFSTLVVTAQAGLNDDQLGEIIKLGMDTPRCCGVAIQPVFGSGRNAGIGERLTPSGVIRRLEKQTNGLLSVDDFIPLPCSHRDCCDITYMLKTSKGEWKSLPALIGRERLHQWIHLVSNTISFENASDTVKSLLKEGVIQRVLSERQGLGALALAADILRMCACVPGLPELLSLKAAGKGISEDALAENTFRITVKQFMDATTFNEARIRQCCVHVGTFEEDPRRYSFCWRWLFEDARDFPERSAKPLRVIS
jgi:uncharacterized radical SAM superfamily Fe-S cluster-containing enzyme